MCCVTRLDKIRKNKKFKSNGYSWENEGSEFKIQSNCMNLVLT